MGTFANLYQGKNSKIPDDKKKEFYERLEKLLQVGGMMEMENVELLGKSIPILRKASMHEDGMDFYYNYFEEDAWENAGFSIDDNTIWSGKIGFFEFSQVMLSAYALQELYTEGTIGTVLNDKLVTSWVHVGWINYLFDEHFHIKNFDSWKLYEVSHSQDYLWNCDPYFGNKRYAFISACEIAAVQHGTEKAIDIAQGMIDTDHTYLETLALKAMTLSCKEIKLSREENSVDMLLDCIKKYYTEDSDDWKNGPANNILKTLHFHDAPAFIIKCIAETYDKDFWELWEQIKHVVWRKNITLFGNDDYYVVPVSTEKRLGVSSDDLILFWEENGKITFSDELQTWFYSLQKRFEEILSEDFTVPNLLFYMLDLMEEASENYYRVFTQAEFFDESLDNLTNKKYHALWKMYDEMIHDSELIEAGNTIFLPDTPEPEQWRVIFENDSSKRRLVSGWRFMKPELKQNKGRVTLRRYMALVANRELRKKVFGF